MIISYVLSAKNSGNSIYLAITPIPKVGDGIIEEGFDYAWVEVSVDGEHWRPLTGQMTSDDDPNGVN